MRKKRITNKKLCSKCGVYKTYGSFYKDITKESGMRTMCIDCTKASRKKAKRTKRGFIATVYNSHVKRSKELNLPKPGYSKQSLTAFLFGNQLFNEIFADWEASNYNRKSMPTVTRKDYNKPFTFGNLYSVNYQDYIYHVGNYRRGISAKAISQVSLKSGEVINTYRSIKEAARRTKASAANINKVLRGILKSSGGFSWKRP